MDPSAQPVLRDMSYRKPVPVYVPTPPPSPYTFPVPPNGLSLDLGSATRDGTPPLPDDWREVIEQASTGNTSSAALPTYPAAGSRPMSPLYDVPLNEPVSSVLSVVPRSYSCVNVSAAESSTSPTSSPTPRVTGNSRRPHLNYRPPTPPLQAHCKRQRIADDDTRCLDAMIPFHIIYPDSPSHGNQAAYKNPAMQNLPTPRRSPAASSLTTLVTDRLFKTEKTQSSNGGTDPGISTAWLGSLSTSDSTLDGDVKRVKSWLNLRVPSRYNSGAAQTARHYDVDTKSHASASFWERMGIVGRVFRVGQGSFSVCALVSC